MFVQMRKITVLKDSPTKWLSGFESLESSNSKRGLLI